MKEKLRRLKLLLLDVDGVMTDGRIIYNADGVETKAFDVKDGHGLKLLQRAGFQVGIITGRQSEVTRVRAHELGIELVIQGAKEKLPRYLELVQRLGLSDEEVAYVGDDLIDLPVLRRVGFSATVADAVEEIKPYVQYITTRPGGRGAVRELCDFILRTSGRWDDVTMRYFEG
jgi:3-deoxy-D-manno-octulosonate 8-phosphate phosphatase (KDO 8-P phosphatase)